jgi:DNA-binding MarR family transcriptional regulator
MFYKLSKVVKVITMCKFKEVYERFNNLVIASEKLSDAPSLEAIEKRILSILSVYWSQGGKLTVNDSLKMIEELSNATAFKYIKQLRIKGYIQVVVDELDNRIKYLSPTNLCNEYFSNLGKCIISAAQAKR